MQDDLLEKEKTASTRQSSRPVIDLKGSVFTLPILRLMTSDLSLIEEDLVNRMAQSLRFFENAPVVIDLEKMHDAGTSEFDFVRLCQLLRAQHLIPVGIRKATEKQQHAAVLAGLAVLKGGALQDAEGQESVVTETAAAELAQSSMPPKAKVVTLPVRSGQQIYAQGSDLIVLAAVNAGAEIIADGNIHVYGPLRGRALAGVMGNNSARVFASSMEPELVAITGHYQIFEDRLPEELHGKPAQVYLDGKKLTVSPLM